LEEAYEVLEALDQEDSQHLREELGDLLLQIGLHAQIATEDEDFLMSEVLHGINAKLVRRHPHVFSDIDVDSVENVLTNWEKIMADERKSNGESHKGMLDGIPLSLPALTQANQIQRRAKRVGFDWHTIEPVIAKVHEELGELRDAQTDEERQAEAGDVLFAVVNLVRWLKVEPEIALRETNLRFRKRFAYIEKQALEQGKSVDQLSFEEMDQLWEAAKVAFRDEENEDAGCE
jgi:tetrapyrrole methylase family protein/MazG family protein